MDQCASLQAKTVKKVGQPMHIILFIVNILFSGVGTMISACIGSGGFCMTTLLVGLCQFLLTFFLIGWIWSIWWGYLIFLKSS